MVTWFANQAQENLIAPNPHATQDDSDHSVSPVMLHDQRRMIYAPLLSSTPTVQNDGRIRIKARIEALVRQVVLMVDRPVLKGYSFWCASPIEAAKWSPLAKALFGSGDVESILIHEMNITVNHQDISQDSNEAVALRLGQLVREHLASGLPIMTDSFLTLMPSEEQIKEALQTVIDEEINPGIAAHSGEITISAVTGNTVYIKMGGGCQGCAASGVTLRDGVEKSFRIAVPQLGALLDETDHAAGRNPFFRVLTANIGT